MKQTKELTELRATMRVHVAFVTVMIAMIMSVFIPKLPYAMMISGLGLIGLTYGTWLMRSDFKALMNLEFTRKRAIIYMLVMWLIFMLEVFVAIGAGWLVKH